MLIVLLLSLADQVAEDLASTWAGFANEWANSLLLAVSLAAPDPPVLPSEPGKRTAALGLNALNERDLRRDLLSLHAMNRALHLFSQVANDTSSQAASTRQSKPKLFISHAKRDGVPLAVSIRSWIKDLPGLDFFYDTDNLDLKGDISAQLEQAIFGSILIVLRTEVFDQCYWCQKEIYWAEKHGVPVLAVDGRWSLQHAPSAIVFDSSPSVRIPDGSIIRILLAAMMEASHQRLPWPEANRRSVRWDPTHRKCYRRIPRASEPIQLQSTSRGFSTMKDTKSTKPCMPAAFPASPSCPSCSSW